MLNLFFRNFSFLRIDIARRILTESAKIAHFLLIMLGTFRVKRALLSLQEEAGDFRSSSPFSANGLALENYLESNCCVYLLFVR